MTNPKEVLETLDEKERRRRAYSTEPRIKVNQEWVARNENGKVLRRVRILAPHPDGGWITKEMPWRVFRNTGYINNIPEFNLRYVFELDKDVCDHRGPLDETYKEGDDHPTYWKCLQCGDTFPLIGDTDRWFPKLLIPE